MSSNRVTSVNSLIAAVIVLAAGFTGVLLIQLLSNHDYSRGYQAGLNACEATPPEAHGTYLGSPEPPQTVE